MLLDHVIVHGSQIWAGGLVQADRQDTPIRTAGGLALDADREPLAVNGARVLAGDRPRPDQRGLRRAARPARGEPPRGRPGGDAESLLLDHVVAGEPDAVDVAARIPNGQGADGPGGLWLQFAADPLTVNGAAIVRTDVEGSNGMVHVIDGALLDPTPAAPSAGDGRGSGTTTVTGRMRRPVTTTTAGRTRRRPGPERRRGG